MGSIIGGDFKARVTHTDGEAFYIDPSHHARRRGVATDSSHTIYPLSAVEFADGGCGVDHTHYVNAHHPDSWPLKTKDGHADHSRDQGHGHDHDQDPSHSHRFGKQIPTPSPNFMERMRARRDHDDGNYNHNTCKIKIIADHRYHALKGGSYMTTVQEMMTAMTVTSNQFFQTNFGTGVGAGIMIATSELEVFETADDPDNIFAADSASATDFLNLQGQQANTKCLAHAFTAQNFASSGGGSVLGLAWVGVLCVHGSSSSNNGMTTALISGSEVPEAQQNLVTVHEVGHNFKMAHDTDCDDYCLGQSSDCTGNEYTAGTSSGGKYTMYPTAVDGSETNHRIFSACSISSAGDHIKNSRGLVVTQQGNEFCFTNEGLEICGNGVVTEKELCDCGSSDAQTCTDNDPCCKPSCELADGAQCSAQKGPCCSSGCLVSTSGVCRVETDCYKAVECNGDLNLNGTCPDKDAQDSQGNYLYHKPNGTICNNGVNICTVLGCTASRCGKFESTDKSGQIPSSGYDTSSYTPEVCFDSSTDGSEACHLACRFQKDGPCVSTQTYLTTEHGKSMSDLVFVERLVGSTCMNDAGYCISKCSTNSNGTEVCDLQCSAASNIGDAFADADILGWIATNWYIVLSIEAGIAAIIFLYRYYQRRQGNRVTVIEAKKINSSKKDMQRFTIRRKPKQHHLVRHATTKRGGIIIELERKRKGDQYPDEAFARMQLLFPTAPAVVVRRVIKSSPHEEAAVFRLLHLGYPMRMLDDYTHLKKAGRVAYHKKTAEEDRLSKAKARQTARNKAANGGKVPLKGGGGGAPTPAGTPRAKGVANPSPAGHGRGRAAGRGGGGGGGGRGNGRGRGRGRGRGQPVAGAWPEGPATHKKQLS